jgi:hypothetical protein
MIALGIGLRSVGDLFQMILDLNKPCAVLARRGEW